MSKHFWYRGRNEIIFSMLERYCDMNSKMLEVGCGKGNVLRYLKNKGMNVEGCDISEKDLQTISVDVPLHRWDVREMNIHNQFDVIGCFDVLEHIEDDGLALKNIRDALKFDGKIIVTVPACALLWSNYDVLGNHFRRYSSKEIRNAIEKAGFRIIRSSYFMFFLFPVLLLMRFLSRNVVAEEDFVEIKIIPVLNDIFLFVLRLEKWLMKFGNLPYGSSVIVVAEKI